MVNYVIMIQHYVSNVYELIRHIYNEVVEQRTAWPVTA